ncbi:MAG: hypothetical protein H0X34_13485 [Chthoniobacterales bacterium]|nr:hypothetical protein [Chthoniobacterales bacterium]
MKSKTVLLFAALTLLAPWPATAVEVTEFEGTAHGFPSMLDANGKKIADGEFIQEVEDGRLSITLKYRFKHGSRRTEEKVVFRQKPELIQEEWSWRELKDGDVVRQYAVDFKTQTATAKKSENGEKKEWSEKIEVKSGQTFTGYGFVLAVQNVRERLVHGEAVELQAIGFNPQPKVVTVKITHVGPEEMEMADRNPHGDHFLLQPQIPAIAKIFVKVPDTHIWLTQPPAEFLRFEGPQLEPSDPIIRVDLLSGAESGPARPVKKSEDR